MGSVSPILGLNSNTDKDVSICGTEQINMQAVTKSYTLIMNVVDVTVLHTLYG